MYIEKERKELVHQKAVFEEEKKNFERAIGHKLEQAIQIGFNKALAVIREFLAVRGLVQEFEEFLQGPDLETEIDEWGDRV